MTMRPLVALPLILLTGCATGTGAKWYAPATWFSHAPADTVDKALTKQDAAREAAVKAAQRATHETAEALAAAPDSRPVAVATDANASAMALLDQAAGALPAGDLAKIRAQVAGLLSDNAKLRAAAERTRDADRANESKLAEKLAAADAAVAKSEHALREAFDRENALANQLRSQVALAWILGGVAVLGCAAYAYARFALGGLPSALGQAKRMLEAKHPEIAAQVAPIYARFLDKRHQSAISAASK